MLLLIPNLVLLRILWFLDLEGFLRNVVFVCQKHNELINSHNNLWKCFDFSYGPLVFIEENFDGLALY